MKKQLLSIFFAVIGLVNLSVNGQCVAPTLLNVSSVTTNSANFSWTKGTVSDTKWEILLVPNDSATSPTEIPSNPTFPNQILQTIETPQSSPFLISGLASAQIYLYYIRTICSDTSFSTWAGPYYFNTQTCDAANKCNYKFLLTTSVGNSWNGGRIQVLQNGILIQTLGSNAINNATGVTIALCPDESVQLYWNIAGTTPGNIGMTMISPFNDILYSKPAGVGSPLTMLYNQPGNCTPPSCSKPLPLAVLPANINTTSASLSWTAQGTATQWEVFVTTFGSAPPTNGSALTATSDLPTAGDGGFYYLANVSSSFLTTNLLPATAYQFYVRAICAANEISNWTILNPIKFITKPLNDECINAFPISINLNQTCSVSNLVHANTFGGTVSFPPVTTGIGCGGTDDDVWFSFVAGLTGSQTINFSNIIGLPAGISINHSVFSGTYNALIKLYCSSAKISTATGLIPGQTYYVNVYTPNVSTNISTYSAEFDICITSPPANDNLNNAQEVAVNPLWQCSDASNQSGNTLGATPSTTPTTTETGCAGTDDDVWYKFTATSNIHIISLNSIVGSPYSVTFNHSIYSGTANAPVLKYCSTSLQSVATELTPNEVYYIRVYTAGTMQGNSATFKICVSSPPPPATNDECNTAINIEVNQSSECILTSGNIIGATASTPSSTCVGVANDDVWFTFTATSNTELISLINIQGTTSELNHAVYSGSCDSGLILKYCSLVGYSSSKANNFIVGQTYYLRIWSNSSLAQVTTFDVCIKSPSTCENAVLFCGSSVQEPFIFPNATGNVSTGEIACLYSTPNSIYYSVKVGLSGPLIYNILQNTAFDGYGNPIGNNLDVDFVAWGPFASAQSCEQIVLGPCTPTPCQNNTTFPNSYPVGNIVDCSYSGSFTETLSIPNAQEGEYYIVLITNFNGSEGFIRMSQTNYSEPDAGQTYCSSKIQLISFIDENNNNIKDNNEINFNLGSFVYQENNSGPFHFINSSTGRHGLYDPNPLNIYDFSYEIFPEYAAYFNASTLNYNDISIPEDSTTQILYFPITQIQSYSNASVSIVANAQPIAGALYTNKIVYKNLSPTILSGTLNFVKDPIVTISSISQSGTTLNETGFSYIFSNLAPFETRSFNVIMQVPSIPTVNIGDILNTQASINITNDVNLNDNIFSNTQTVVAAYDPNDKMEAHGERIDISTFSNSDYLYYTIRFQNTGNSNAINVRVKDLLDSQFNFNSVRMISSSHIYTMERINNQLVWNFVNIQLVPITQNEALSQGYVSFKIKLNPGFEVGDLIPNSAEIYFDTNPAIVTNTFVTEFQLPLSAPTFSQENIILFPNPARNLIQINLQNSNEQIKSLIIYDLLGKEVKTTSSINDQAGTINVSNLSKGVYVVEITTENKFKLVKKLVIE